MVFPVVMYGCESWTSSKKAECWRIDVFELWCWRKLLRVHWTARRSNQSIIKEISPEYSLDGLMLKLMLQYFGHLMWRTDSSQHQISLWCWERLKAGAEGEDRGWDGWMASSTHWTWVWARSGSWWWTMKPGMLQSIGLQRLRHDWVTELNWIDDKYTYPKFSFSFSKTLKWFYPWFESQLCSFVVNLLILILNEKIGYEDWCLEGILKNGACVKLLAQKQEGRLRVGWGGVTYHRQWGGKPG